MKTKAGVAALLLGVMGIATGVVVMAESIEIYLPPYHQCGENMGKINLSPFLPVPEMAGAFCFGI